MRNLPLVLSAVLVFSIVSINAFATVTVEVIPAVNETPLNCQFGNGIRYYYPFVTESQNNTLSTTNISTSSGTSIQLNTGGITSIASRFILNYTSNVSSVGTCLNFTDSNNNGTFKLSIYNSILGSGPYTAFEEVAKAYIYPYMTNTIGVKCFKLALNRTVQLNVSWPYAFMISIENTNNNKVIMNMPNQNQIGQYDYDNTGAMPGAYFTSSTSNITNFDSVAVSANRMQLTIYIPIVYEEKITDNIPMHINDWSDVSTVNAFDGNSWRTYNTTSGTGDLSTIGTGQWYYINTKTGNGYSMPGCMPISKCMNLQSGHIYISPFTLGSLDDISYIFSNFTNIESIQAFNGKTYTWESYTSSYSSLSNITRGEAFIVNTKDGSNYTINSIQKGTFCTNRDIENREYVTYNSSCGDPIYSSCPSTTMCVSYTDTDGAIPWYFNTVGCLNYTSGFLYNCINQYGNAVTCGSITTTNSSIIGLVTCKNYTVAGTSYCFDSSNNCNPIACPSNYIPETTDKNLPIIALILAAAAGFVVFILTSDKKAEAFGVPFLLILMGFAYIGWFPVWVILLMTVFTAVMIFWKSKGA